MRLKLLGYLEQVTQTILLHVIPLTFERPVYSAKTGKSIPLTQYIQELSEEMKILQRCLRRRDGNMYTTISK